MNENTINEKKKIDIGTVVQMSKYLHYNSPASQGDKWNGKRRSALRNTDTGSKRHIWDRHPPLT